MNATQRVVRSTPVDDFPPPTDAEPNTALRDPLPRRERGKAETELIITALKQTYAGIGMAVQVFLDPADGFRIITEADDLAESWRNLLDNDPKLRKIMLGLIKGGGWGSVIMAHAAVALPIIQNHREGLTHLVKPRNKTASNDTTTTETATPAY